MFNKKSIVLNGVDERNKRAVLTLECDGEITKGVVRLYNYGAQPRGIISLGLYYDGKVTKAGLTHAGNMVFNFSCQIDQIPKKFSCAIVNFVDGEPKPILYGNSEGYLDHEEVFAEVVSSLSTAQNTAEVEEKLNEYGIDFDDELKEEIEQNITKCLKNEECGDCENCQYKKFYYQSIKSLNEERADLEKEVDEKEVFYNEMKAQIDQLFANNPSEEYLEELISNSKWVKVNLAGGDDYYVLGLIYDDNKLNYICYGVPGVYQKVPPRELSGYPIWFPLDENKPQGFGYWLSYQDADSGESVKAIVV